jgi:hypothetical protein
MVNTKRYQGLLFLKEQGIPVPDFIKIDSCNQLGSPFFDIYAPFGWTLRTCKKDGKNEVSLFYKNKISKELLKEILKERLVNFPDEFYIVYHSWDFDFSFNIIKTRYNYIVEGKFGSQKNMSSGFENPDFSIEYDRLTESFKNVYTQQLDINSKRYVFSAIQYLDNINMFDDLYSEVAITKTGEMFFYEFWNVKLL